MTSDSYAGEGIIGGERKGISSSLLESVSEDEVVLQE